jgi:hypothetical protein
VADSSRTLNEVKSKQCVLIAKAGMAVPTYDMSSERLDEHIMTQFKHHVENYKLPANLAKFPRNNFFRTTKHLAESVSVNDIHTGLSLWRKFASLKKYVNNVITPIYLKNLGPDGLIPSGRNHENILSQTRQHLWESEELVRKQNSKKKTYELREFRMSWYPVEWEVFLNFGRCADKPEPHFFFE